MRPIPFDLNLDLPPIPFDQEHLQLALEMKKLGLRWRPHVGCFVWDRDGIIQAESPFPLGVYFILSLLRFIEIFGDIASMKEKLVWLPTWHQAHLIAINLGVAQGKIAALWSPGTKLLPGDELLGIYRLIMEKL